MSASSPGVIVSAVFWGLEYLLIKSVVVNNLCTEGGLSMLLIVLCDADTHREMLRVFWLKVFSPQVLSHRWAASLCRAAKKKVVGVHL